MAKSYRPGRIGEEIRRVISAMMLTELKDPRISSLVSIMAVDVTEDYSYATVYVSVYGSDEEKEKTLKAFRSGAGFIQHEIGKQIKIRHVPKLIFKIDNTIEYGMHISKIIHDIGKDTQKDNEEE